MKRICIRHVPVVLLVAIVLLPCLWTQPVLADQAQWIWSANHAKDKVPTGACYFRRSFELGPAEKGTIAIAADNQYELFLNGRYVGRGDSWDKLRTYNVTDILVRGRNVLAVKVINRKGDTAGLAARISVKEKTGATKWFSTDETWITNLRPFPFWTARTYSDRNWKAAQKFGPFGSTAPWHKETQVAKNDTGAPNAPKTADPPNTTNTAANTAKTASTPNTAAAVTQGEKKEKSDFQINPAFEVQLVADHDQTGSLIAITFNEFGDLLASQENGPILSIADSDGDNIPDKVHIVCDKVKNCQGLLALNGEVFAVGQGPEGSALYRLADEDRDGKFEKVRTIVKFTGEMSRHGPHGLVLGPDGLIYLTVGGLSGLAGSYDDKSPHRNYYEGDLAARRYEDPRSHATGIKAPGGVVIRTDAEGKSVELVAGGLRNAYDLAFNRFGDLFTFDSDMEWDEGLPWYRPARLIHVVPGAEYGWRSGWAKWPDYYVDSLPAVLDAGRATPAGLAVYDHFMFPLRFHGGLFACDWSSGRILQITATRNGATYAAKSEIFVTSERAKPTDIEVGNDGWLYFCTGGGNAAGGVYRVVWKGTVPEKIKNLGKGISIAIRQPQLQSAWGRQQAAALRLKMDEDFSKQVQSVAVTNANRPRHRIRALDLMQLVGPAPSNTLLVTLSKDASAELRAKTADLMGLHVDDQTHQRLVELLSDQDATVRRKACEALARSGRIPAVKTFSHLLASEDRHEAYAARRLLERVDPEKWRDAILKIDHPRAFIQGAVALMTVRGDKENALKVAARTAEFFQGDLSDGDFIDMLRVMQLAMARGPLTADDVPEIRDRLAREFPAADHTINRELIRLLVHLQASSIADRYIDYLQSDIPDIEKLHLALHLGSMKSGFTVEQKAGLLQIYDAAFVRGGGRSYRGYLQHVARDFAKTLAPNEQRFVIADGDKYRFAALSVLFHLPEKADPVVLQYLRQLDEGMSRSEGEAARRFQIGIVATLARSGDDASIAYLRKVFDRDPERRRVVVMGLAQQPGDENWEYLVRSLKYLEGNAAREVLQKLRSVELRPQEPHYYRSVILCGLKMQGNGSENALELLQHWSGRQLSSDGDPWYKALAAWQKWFAEKYPDLPPAELPADSGKNKWTLGEVQKHLRGEAGAKASPQRGRQVFQTATCMKCHRHGGRGGEEGPDLTGIARTYASGEILESILYPSYRIGDEYRAKKTAMPEGLLNGLSEQEITDLFSYLMLEEKTDVARRPGDDEKKKQ